MGDIVLPPPPGPIPPREDDRPLRLSHSGERYLLGYGADFFGIWERERPDAPVRRFPRTEEGWREAWAAYVAMEPRPSAVGTPAGPAVGPAPWGAAPPRQRVNGAWWLLPILLGWIGGLVAYFAVRGTDPQTARAMLIVGIVLSLVGVIILASMPATP